MPSCKLTNTKIAKATDGLHSDGHGLYLQVRNNGAAKSWIFRWKKGGQEKVMGLGPLHTIDLDEAREQAGKWRKVIFDGGDPLAVRAGVQLDEAHKLGLAKTVGALIEEYVSEMIVGGGLAKGTVQQAVKLLGIAHRAIGGVPVQKVTTGMFLDTVGFRDMWTEKHATALNFHSYFKRMFDYAIHKGYFTGENPAQFKGHLSMILPAGWRIHRVTHRTALPSYKDIGAFMQALRSHEDRSCRQYGRLNCALLAEFVVLTGARLGEAVHARWNHIDRESRTWVVPPENHKVGPKTRTPILRPISIPMTAVLDEMARRYPNRAPDGLIFPSQFRGATTPFNLQTAWKFVQYALKYDITVHGFRSTLTEFCRANGYAAELYNLQLGHVVGNKTDQAYARSQLVEQRREMMEHWGRYCAQPTPEPTEGTNVTSLVEHRRKDAAS